VVATQAAAPGFLTVYPCKDGLPSTSSVNYAPGNESTNLVTVPLDGDGRICVYSFERTEVVIDLLGAFGAPGALRQLQVGGVALDPPFRPDIHDYSLHCPAASNPITYAATAMPGVTLTVNGTPAGTAPTGSAPLATDQALVITAGTEQYWARCLPADFPRLTVKKTGPVAPGYYLMEDGVASAAGRFVMILDTNGVPVWYRRVPPSIDFKLLPDGNLAWMNFVRANFNRDLTKRYEEHTLDGTLVRTIGAGPTLATDYHDMVPLTDGTGDAIVVAYSLRTVPAADIPPGFPPMCGGAGPDKKVIDAILQRSPPTAAYVVVECKDHTDLTESVPVCDVMGISGSTATAHDLLHLNSSTSTRPPATFLGARYMNAVLRISQTTGGAMEDRRLDGHQPRRRHPFSVLGDRSARSTWPTTWLILGGHLTMFDNRQRRRRPDAGRGVRHRRHRPHDHVRVAAPHRRPVHQPACKSFGLGSVRRQPDGNTVIAWGGEPSRRSAGRPGRHVPARRLAARRQPHLPR
jgi:hypothetical protein